MGQREILIKIAQNLDKFKIPYLLTGSFAVSYYGSPRATHDIDFVILATQDNKHQFDNFLKNFSKEFIFQPFTLPDNLDNYQYNLVHDETGIKIDFWIINGREFEIKYEHRKIIKFKKYKIPLISVEDLIIQKLLWCKEVYSERHYSDCENMWQIQKKNIDIEKLNKDIKQLGLTNLFKEVISK